MRIIWISLAILYIAYAALVSMFYIEWQSIPDAGAFPFWRWFSMVALLPTLISACAFFYLLPTFVASQRGHLSVLAIGLANFVFGWTFIGWIACLIWALTGDTRGNRRLVSEA